MELVIDLRRRVGSRVPDDKGRVTDRGSAEQPARGPCWPLALPLLLALPLRGLGRGEPAGAATSPTTTAGLSPLSDRRVVTGWIPYWDFADGVAGVIDNADVVAEISPFWYRATLGSQVQPQTGNANPESTLVTAIDELQAAGVAVLPSVTDDGIDSGEMANLLSDPDRRGALLIDIVAMVERTGADGVDLDFEDMNFGGTASDKTTVKRRYPLFLENLRSRLNSRGAVLSVAVPSRRSASDPNWAVFDYDAIGRSVDRARIMTYDYSTESTDPGPIAPIEWTREVMRYAASEFSRVPLSVGVPAYGQNWPIETVSGNCPSGVGAETTVSPTSQQALAWSRPTAPLRCGASRRRSTASTTSVRLPLTESRAWCCVECGSARGGRRRRGCGWPASWASRASPCGDSATRTRRCGRGHLRWPRTSRLTRRKPRLRLRRQSTRSSRSR